MSVYLITNERLRPLEETSFEYEGITERYDLQRILRDQPEVLEEGLFVLAEEYGDWAESRRRIDLLALDSEGRLVVVELKRSDWDESLMDLQAIRYAAMVANMTLTQAIDAHRHYLDNRGIEGDPESRIRDHLGIYDEDIHISTERPRIILASANFSKELTTGVLWLNDVGLDITCVKLQPCKMDDSIFVERSQVIPIPEAADYMIRLRDRETEQQVSSQVKDSPGGDAFRAHIETPVPVEKRNLERLYKLAIDLEREGLASLLTREGTRNTTLHVRVPDHDFNLLTIHKRGQYCNLQFSVRHLERYASKSKERLDEILNIEDSRIRYYGDESAGLPQGLEKALRQAYTETKNNMES